MRGEREGAGRGNGDKGRGAGGASAPRARTTTTPTTPAAVPRGRPAGAQGSAPASPALTEWRRWPLGAESLQHPGPGLGRGHAAPPTSPRLAPSGAGEAPTLPSSGRRGGAAEGGGPQAETAGCGLSSGVGRVSGSQPSPLTCAAPCPPPSAAATSVASVLHVQNPEQLGFTQKATAPGRASLGAFQAAAPQRARGAAGVPAARAKPGSPPPAPRRSAAAGAPPRRPRSAGNADSGISRRARRRMRLAAGPRPASSSEGERPGA